MSDVNSINNTFTTPSAGVELIRASKQYAIENVAKSWFAVLSTFVLAILAFTAIIYFDNTFVKLFFSVLYGLIQVRLFVIYHDYLHHAILRESKIAKPIMTAYGIYALAPTGVWKRTHDYHHTNNSKLSSSGIGSFPLLSREQYEGMKSSKQFMYRLSRHPLTIFLGYITLFILDFNVKSIVNNPKANWESVLALVLHVVYGTIAWILGGFFVGFILCFFLPYLIMFGMGSYLFYIQHNFPTAQYKENKDWNYTYAAMNSTSCLKTNALMHWFTANIGYHHVHHLNHRIPFYRLKEVMNKMPELQHPKTVTLSIKDIIECFRIKVWDTQAGKMMPF